MYILCTHVYIILITVLLQVSNQLTVKCQEILLYTSCRHFVKHLETDGVPDSIWDLIFNDKKEVDSHQTAQLTTSPTLVDFMMRLKDVIDLAGVYKDTVHHLKDTLLIQQTFTTGGGAVGLVSKRPVVKSLVAGARGGTKKISLMCSSNSTLHAPSDIGGSSMPHIQSGLSLSIVSDIVMSLSDLSERCAQVIKLIESVCTLKNLWPRLTGLPRVEGIWDDPIEEKKDKEDTIDGYSTCSSSPSPSTYSLVYSSEDVDSIAYLVKSVLSSLLSLFVDGTPNGAIQVFAVSGRDKIVFDPLYKRYEEILSTVQGHICNYLTVSSFTIVHVGFENCQLNAHVYCMHGHLLLIFLATVYELLPFCINCQMFLYLCF